LLSFREPAYAGIIALPPLYIGDTLKMQVRRPVTVLETHPEFGDHLATGDVLALIQILQRIQAEVAVEGVKADAFEVMREDQGGAIILVPDGPQISIPR